MFYSKSTMGFYDPEIHSEMPADAREISNDQYAALFAAQATGKMIVTGADGFPTLGDSPAPPPPSAEEIKASIQKQIDDLERGYMMPRATREALLAYAVTLASSNGVTEAQLYAGNIAYRKVKDFDSQIASLRAQL